VRISLEGQSLGRYHIQSKIGDSAHSNVYQTYDRLREQQIALKALQTNSIPYHVMDASLDETNFFQQEVDLVHSLNHAHILPLWNSGKSYVSGNPFVYKTMPYYEEGSLADWLHKNGNKPLLPREVCHIISQLADALQYVHDRQIAYQNIKLSNIIIRDKTKNMYEMHVLLADFAISQDGTFFSRTHEAYPYMAPERWNSQAFPASDQYGLAVIAYELLAGRPPFQGNAEHIMRRLHINMQPQPPSTFNPALSPAVSNVLLRSLAKRPEDRFASIADFANALQRYCP
ncbi:MAG TPA: serine/threonine-protein kinase, partial [Ktedonobacteraceae bacterium]|nr:serine/threonine-protein kinase [Ktedonobacteraceae bacterium]